MAQRRIGVRWTIGDVAPEGFAALRLSIWGALGLFGQEAQYAVCVNSLPLQEARRRTGDVPAPVRWLPAGPAPDALEGALDATMAQGVAWKLAPLRLFHDRYELSLDNDCILWAVPKAIRRWLDEPEPRCLIAADVRLAHGAFTGMTRPEPRNTGIRGLPPGYDLAAALGAVLAEHPVPLSSELDEQGLQVTAMDRPRPALVVPTDDVTICSPFWPHQAWLGRCGAHFVGLNTKDLPFAYYGRPARERVLENWRWYLPELHRRVGLEMAA
jgi:hypothetical protein